jgi:hypothetical protein
MIDNFFGFRRRGDANGYSDNYVVSSDLIVGRMVLIIPSVGHVFSISHSFLGFLLLFIAPGIVVICAEAISIVKKK